MNSMIRIAIIALLLLASVPNCLAGSSLFIEELTWPEVQSNIASGKTTAIYYAGSTEQNGPHMTAGKHSIVARYIAERIARKLGNALVYPILPFAPTGDPEKKTDHMRFPGSVSLNDATFGAIAREVTFSARAAGFRNVVLMGDHGGGQQALKSVAEELNAKWAPDGIHVFYIPDLYYRSLQLAEEELRSRELKDGNHAGIIDTSELLFIDRKRKFIRVGKIAIGSEANGVDGDPRRATRQLGKRFVSFKIDSAVNQIRMLTQE